MTFEENGIAVTLEQDLVRVCNLAKGTSVEYRGQVPGGLACSPYAERILKARALETRRRAG